MFYIRFVWIAIALSVCSSIFGQEEGKDFPYPPWISEEDKTLFQEQFFGERRQRREAITQQSMDLLNRLPQETKKELWSPGVNSWFKVDAGVGRRAKVVRFALYVDKTAYDSAKGFWREEKNSIDSLLKESPPTIFEFCQRLIKVTRSFNDIHEKEDSTISFCANSFNFEDSDVKGLGVVVRFNLWDAQFQSTQRLFFHELVEHNGDTYFPGRVRPYSYILIGRDFNKETNERRAKELANTPNAAFRASPDQYKMMQKILAEDDNLTESERETLLDFTVDDQQKLKTYQIEEVGDGGKVQHVWFNTYVPNGTVVSYSDLHRLLSYYIRAQRNAGVSGHFRITILPKKRAQWEYTRLVIVYEGEG